MTAHSENTSLYLYGIKNCDTIKKAKKWLEEQQVAYQFHDYRADGLDAELLRTFIDQLGWESLLNTCGTTWRKLDESVRQSINNADSAAELMLAQPAIIKRPLLAHNHRMLLGFNPDQYTHFLAEEKIR